MPARPLPQRLLSGQRAVVTFDPSDRRHVLISSLDTSCPPQWSDEVWLEDVTFVSPGSDRPSLVGSILRNRSPKVTRKNGWTRIGLDGDVANACFFDVEDGSCVRTAKYVFYKSGKLMGFGALATPRGPDLSSRRVAGPRRRSWRGDMGGLNFDMPAPASTMKAVGDVLSENPGHVILDGADDWYAPLAVRPAALAARYDICPLSFWHTGTSGQVASGVVLGNADYQRFSQRYVAEFGHDIEHIPGTKPPTDPQRPCGCWAEQGVLVYR